MRGGSDIRGQYRVVEYIGREVSEKKDYMAAQIIKTYSWNQTNFSSKMYKRSS